MTTSESSRSYYLLAAGVVVVAALLRLWHLGELSIGVDDGVSILEASRPWSGVVPFILQIHDVAPPLFFFWLHPWAAASVHSGVEAWFRSAVVPWSLGTVVATMAIGRRLGGDRLALAAGLLTATSGFLVYYSSEIRMYPMATACLLVATWALLEPLSPARTALAAGAALAAMFSHYLTVPYIMTLLVWRAAAGRRWQAAAVPALVCGVALLLWSPVLHAQMGAQPLELRPAPGVGQAVELLAQLGCGFTWPVPLTDWVPSVPPSKLLMFIALAGWLAWSLGRRRQPLLTAMLVAPFLMIWGLSVGTHLHIFEYKYFQFSVPFLMLALAWPLAASRQAVALSLVAVLMVLNVAGWLVFRADPFFYGPQDWRGMLEHMRPLVASGDFVVVHPSLMAQTVMVYAYTSEPFLFLQPDEMTSQDTDTRLRVVPVDGPQDVQLLAVEGRAKRLWLLEAPNHPFVEQSGLEASLRQRWKVESGFETRSFWPANVLRGLLLIKSPRT